MCGVPLSKEVAMAKNSYNLSDRLYITFDLNPMIAWIGRLDTLKQEHLVELTTEEARELIRACLYETPNWEE